VPHGKEPRKPGEQAIADTRETEGITSKELEKMPEPQYTAEQKRMIDFVERQLKLGGVTVPGRHLYAFEKENRGWLVSVWSPGYHGFGFHIMETNGQLRIIGDALVYQ
jgi:hypothetical protein